MKNEITTEHFNYVNSLVKILGFTNLGDFKSTIPYTILKNNQENICLKFNESIDNFKKLFPLEKFNLRKFNYKFKNIDQIIGFIKKLFDYLTITWHYVRIKGVKTLRLIPPKNIYKEYIMNLRENPQISDIPNSNETENNFKLENVIMMDSLLKYLKKSFEKKYISTSYFYMGYVHNDFDYYHYIKIRKYDGNKCDIGTIIKFSIGSEHFYEKIEENSEFDSDNYFIYNISLPNHSFYAYNEIKLQLLTNNVVGCFGFFDFIVNGSNFNTKIPKNITKSTIVFHINNKEYIASDGIFKLYLNNIDNSNKVLIEKEKLQMESLIENPKKLDHDKIIEMKIIYAIIYYENKNKVYLKDIYHNNNYLTKCVFFDNDIYDTHYLNYYNSHQEIIKNLKESTELKKHFIEKGYMDVSNNNYCFGFNYTTDILRFIVCINEENKYILKYSISRPAHIIRHINILNHFSSSYSFTASIESNNVKTYDFGNIEMNTNYIRLEQNEYINLRNKREVSLHLVIEIPKDKLDDWATLHVSYGYFFVNENLEKILENEPSDKNLNFIN